MNDRLFDVCYSGHPAPVPDNWCTAAILPVNLFPFPSPFTASPTDSMYYTQTRTYTHIHTCILVASVTAVS